MSDGALPLTDPAALQQALTQMPPAVTGQMAPPNTLQPNIPPAMPPPNVGTSQTQDQIAQQPAPNLGSAQGGQQGPPKQSAVPALAGFLQQMIKGPGYEQAAPGQPGRPISRLDAFESFIGNFLNSFSQGMANAGTGPAANARGFGAAVQAPYQRELQQYQLGQQQQQVQAQTALGAGQAAEAQARAQQMGQMVTLPNGMTMPFAIASKVYPALISGQAKVQAAATQKRFMSTPYGVYDTQTQNYVGGAAAGGIGATVKMTQEMADSGQYGAGAAQLVGKNVKLSDLSSMERATSGQYGFVQGASGPTRQMKVGPTGNLGIGSPLVARGVQVADPDNPGGTKYVTLEDAIRQKLPGAASASVTAVRSLIKDFTSGPEAKTLNSFNTATDHLRILAQVGDALDNGDITAVNSLAQQYRKATGNPAPTNFDLVKQAVAGEIAKTFKGVATEGEISAINESMNKAMSPEALKGVIDYSTQLMASKRGALLDQYVEGLKGKPAFPTPTSSTGAASKVDALAGKYGAPKQ